MTGKKNKFLYEVVYNTLREEILGNKHKCNDLLPSEREIIERFKVDRTTVRKALSLLVADELVEKKAGVGTKVVYDANQPKFRGSSQNNVAGFFMPKTINPAERITQPFYSELYFHLEGYLKKLDYSIIYTTLKDEHELGEILANQGLQGAVFLTAVSPQLVEYAKRIKLPSVLVNRFDSDLTCVLGNNVYGGYTAVNYLLAHKHRNIAIISAPNSYITAQERLMGCRKAFEEAGLSMNDAVVVPGEWEYESGARAAREIFSVDKSKRPTALFAFNDMMAMGAISVIREMGLKVPGDVSVIGFDNVDYLRYTESDLTTIDTQTPLMAQIIAHNLVGLIKKETPNGMRIDVPTKLVERKTVLSL